MRVQRTLVPSLTILVLLATGAAAGAWQVSSVAVDTGSLTLQPLVSYDRAILAVSGEGRRVLRRVFAPGEPIAFFPVDRDGSPLGDGSYRWELRLVIDGDGFAGELAAPTVLRQSGSVRVRDGAIVAPAGSGPETLTPATAAGITVSSGNPGIILEDTTSGDDDFLIGVDADSLGIVHEGTTELVTVQSGVVGLFQSAPDSDVTLHISNSATAAPSIRFEGTTASWELVQSTDDLQFRDSDLLFPPIVLELAQTASAYSLECDGAGTSDDGDCDLFIDGDGDFTGTVTQGSSRDIKRDLEPAAGAELLAAVNELPLYAWSYKKDAPGIRHLGPMAEDFHAAFGLGKDDKHISPSDTAGLALAAIQALTERLEQKERRIETLERRLAALEATSR